MTYLLLDWIAVTDRNNRRSLSYSSHPLLHDFHNWLPIGGQNGYTEGAKHPLGIRVYRNPLRNDMGTHTIYSGKAITKMNEMYGIEGIDILKHHIKNGHTVARLDVALDFVNTGLTVEQFQEQFMMGYCETRLRSASEVRNLTGAGHTFYIGSRKTRKKLIRVYDKAAEQNIEGDWLRVELQLMGKVATSISKKMYESSDTKAVLLGAIKDVVHFPHIFTWSQTFQDASEVHLGSNSSEKGKTQEWLMKQCLPALAKQIVVDHAFWMQFKLALNGYVDDIYKSEV